MVSPEQRPSVVETLNTIVNPYTLNAHWGDTKDALEILIPHLEIADTDETSFATNYETYPLRHIGNIGARIVRSVPRAGSYRYTGTPEDYGYEVKFEPVLDENQRSGMPIDYIGYLVDDVTGRKKLYGAEEGANHAHVEYRQIGSPIAIPDIPDEYFNEEEAMDYQIMRRLLSAGAHGKELFSAVGCSTGIKLALALANELREAGIQPVFSPTKSERLAKILSNINLVQQAADFELGQVVDLGVLQLEADGKSIEATISTGPDELPYIGYCLSQEGDHPHLESTGFVDATPANDMDALVFELMLRHHTGNWFHPLKRPAA